VKDLPTLSNERPTDLGASEHFGLFKNGHCDVRRIHLVRGETWQKLENYSSTPPASTLISSINVANEGGRLTGKDEPLVPVAPLHGAALKTQGRGPWLRRRLTSFQSIDTARWRWQFCVGSAMALRSR